jgi:hypothetical protein
MHTSFRVLLRDLPGRNENQEILVKKEVVLVFFWRSHQGMLAFLQLRLKAVAVAASRTLW